LGDQFGDLDLDEVDILDGDIGDVFLNDDIGDDAGIGDDVFAIDQPDLDAADSPEPASSAKMAAPYLLYLALLCFAIAILVPFITTSVSRAVSDKVLRTQLRTRSSLLEFEKV